MKNKTEEAAAKARAEARTEELERAVADVKTDRKNIKLYNECLNRYTNSMQKSLKEVESFYDQLDLQRIHDDAKSNVLEQVRN